MGHAEIESYAALRAHAARVLPRALLDDMLAGAGRGVTAAANEDAFDDVHLLPRAAVGWESRDLATTVLGAPVSMPVLLAPVGGLRLVHPDGAPGAASAAGRAGTIAAVSMMAGHTPGQVAAHASGPLWQQVYLSHGYDTCAGLIAAARAAGFQPIAVTVDCPVSPKKIIPMRVSLATARRFGPQLLTRPGWTWRFVRDGADLATANAALGPRKRQTALWSDMAWLKEQWDGPLIVKGVLSAADARRAVDAGADAVVVSNHGGMSLDGAPATIRALPEIAAAVGDEIEVYLDGGVRQGSDVIRALALGARAVLIGRPMLLGLAAAGSAGVDAVLDMFRRQIDVALAMVGARSVRELDPTFARIPASWREPHTEILSTT